VPTLRVTVTSKAILVDGEQLVPVSEGEVDAGFMQGGFLIRPLLDALQDKVQAAEAMAMKSSDAGFEPTSVVLADQATPYRLVTLVLYALGQAEVSRNSIAVRGRDGSLAVIPIYLPRLEDVDDDALALTVAPDHDGVRLAARGRVLVAVDGCPEQGPTVCNIAGADARSALDRARQLSAEGDFDGAERELERGARAYRWHAVHDQVMAIADKHPDESMVTFSAVPDLPWAVVVRAISAVTHRREAPPYDSNEELWNAEPTNEAFSRVSLAIAQ
jgi:hypothetical protein